MNFKESITTLQKHYGTQAKAAKALGFSVSHMSAIAVAGKAPTKTERYVRLFAHAIQSGRFKGLEFI
jgi:hypothetical protein